MAPQPIPMLWHTPLSHPPGMVAVADAVKIHPPPAELDEALDPAGLARPVQREHFGQATTILVPVNPSLVMER